MLGKKRGVSLFIKENEAAVREPGNRIAEQAPDRPEPDTEP